MHLTVLPAVERGDGCVFRKTIKVPLASGGKAELIVSSCQERRFREQRKTKLGEIDALKLPAVEAQTRLQSWIDGGSPCDSKYAVEEDQLPRDQQMAAEFRFFGRRTIDPFEMAMLFSLVMSGMPPDEVKRQIKRMDRLRLVARIHRVLMYSLLVLSIVVLIASLVFDVLRMIYRQ